MNDRDLNVSEQYDAIEKLKKGRFLVGPLNWWWKILNLNRMSL